MLAGWPPIHVLTRLMTAYLQWISVRHLHLTMCLHKRTVWPVKDIILLLESCLHNTYFSFQGQFHEQVEGAVMGSPGSPIVANLYMEYFEQKALSSANHPLGYDWGMMMTHLSYKRKGTSWSPLRIRTPWKTKVGPSTCSNVGNLCVMRNIWETSRTFGERFKEHLKEPFQIQNHSCITDHTTTQDNF